MLAGGGRGSNIIKILLTEYVNAPQVEFTVTEPILSVELSLEPSEATYEQGDTITVNYLLFHSPDSLTPAYNVRVSSGSTLLKLVADEVADDVAGDVVGDVISDVLLAGELAVGEEKRGTLRLLLSGVPSLGGITEVWNIILKSRYIFFLDYFTFFKSLFSRKPVS